MRSSRESNFADAPNKAGRISAAVVSAIAAAPEWVIAAVWEIVAARVRAIAAAQASSVAVADQVAAAAPSKASIAAEVQPEAQAKGVVPALVAVAVDHLAAVVEAAVEAVVEAAVEVVVDVGRTTTVTRVTEFMEEEMKLLKILTNRRSLTKLIVSLTLSAAVLMTLGFSAISIAATAATQKSFPSAEAAVKATVAAAKANDDKELLAIFGAQAKDLMSSGDPVADKQRRAEFLAAYEVKNRIAQEGEKSVLTVGKDDWPFPIPLVKKADGWVFDTQQGREEVLNRRVDNNELLTIQVCRAVVDAQREYAMKDRDKNGLLEYAQKFRSDPGKRNGLYWEAKQGEAESPLGPIMSQAKTAGYQGKPSSAPAPYHGYYYKILTAQGKDAPGGAYSYLVKGKMIGGFGVVAYPAEYENSGVMTFIVNHDGKVFQKDLGNNTASVAKGMTVYNPDSTWTEVKQ